MKRASGGGVLPILLLSLWLTAVGAGFVYLTGYHLAASRGGQVPPAWPAQSKISLHKSQHTLVMLLHPHCACSRASLAELERVLVKIGARVSPYVVFTAEGKMAAEVESTDLWRYASKLPGVRAIIDRDGQEARKFGSFSSGQVALYSRSGELLFQGGITASRGHEGDNLGSQTIIELVRDSAASTNATPVFGCGLLDKFHATSPEKVDSAFQRKPGESI